MPIATWVIRLSCSVSASLLDHPRRDTHRKQAGLAEKALGHFRRFSGCCFWNLPKMRVYIKRALDLKITAAVS